MNIVLKSAIQYGKLGFRVFPLHSVIGGYCTCGKPKGEGHKVGKHPACAHGCNDGTTDESVIRQWWEEKSWANLGIALDKQYLGLDIDPRHGGTESLKDWEEEHGALPQTPTVKTGSEGLHKYFRLPPGVIVRNKAAWAPGIDTRSEGGYLVAPPSVHESGQRYEWLVALDEPLALAPDWLIAIVGEKASTSTPPSTPTPKALSFIYSNNVIDFATHPGEGEGKRHDALCRLTGIHLDRGDSLKSIEAMAIAWGERCNPPCEPNGVLAKVRGLAKRDATRKGLDWIGEEDGENDLALNVGKEGKKDSEGSSGGILSFPILSFPCENANAEVESEGGNSFLPSQAANAETKSDLPNPLTPIQSTESINICQTEIHDPYLPKKHFANPESQATPLEGEREEYVQAEAGSESEAFTFADGVYVCDTASIQPPDDWPTLSPEAYHGIIGDIVKAIEPESEADPAGLLLTLLTAVGNSVGRKAYFSAGPKRHYANLFSVIVGISASRKGMTWDDIEYIMRSVDRDWYTDCIGNGLSSGEGLIERVADDEVTADDLFAPVSQKAKRLFALEEEFVRLLAVKGREGNTINANIRKAWDGSPLETMTRSNGKKVKPKNKATNHHISMLGHITPKELRKTMGASIDMSNGFVNRFLWACVRRSKGLPQGGNTDIHDAWIEPLRVAISKAKSVGRVVRDDEAEALWKTFYDALSAKAMANAEEEDEDEAVARAEPQTLRLSLIYAILDGSAIVKVEHLRAALAVWRYCEASARRIFRKAIDGTVGGVEVRGEAPFYLRLCDAIVKTPGILRSELLRAFRGTTADALGEGLDTLVKMGLAHMQEVKPDGSGRKGEHWYPGPKDDDPDDGGKEGKNYSFVFSTASEDDGKEGKNCETESHGPGANSFLPSREPEEEPKRETLPPNPNPPTQSTLTESTEANAKGEPHPLLASTRLEPAYELNPEPEPESQTPTLTITHEEWTLGELDKVVAEYGDDPRILELIIKDKGHQELTAMLIEYKKRFHKQDPPKPTHDDYVDANAVAKDELNPEPEEDKGSFGQRLADNIYRKGLDPLDAFRAMGISVKTKEELEQESQAYGETELFQELELEQQPEPGDNQDDMSMQDFENMLKCHKLTIDDARNAGKLTPKQKTDVKHAQEYARAQALNRKHRRELMANPIPDDKWDQALDDALCLG